MPDTPSHVAFFGDAEKTFALPPAMILELERVTNAGIGGLSRRFFAGEFRHRELLETVRLGLIGGGENPEEAAALVATYAATMPVMQLYALALPIIETAMFGANPTKKRGKR
ncbi:gene transfer agent family protein [Aliihoeflea sp. 2WW]|uniref:gene transfer agent family protein n=1 Tax=Aliihoeflea sp. 2WW TaxID=1381123 RepID=UPI0004678F3B|nr:gene transfer agent family protein [Aliihoeflea sp. 2WW]